MDAIVKPATAATNSRFRPNRADKNPVVAVMIAAVLAVQSVAVVTIVGSALVERSALQGGLVDSLT